jgi:hypothetical protein
MFEDIGVVTGVEAVTITEHRSTPLRVNRGAAAVATSTGGKRTIPAP